MNNDKKENVPLTVLVIEDHPDQRDLLAIVLQREGYKVITAANGLEALEKLETDKVQIALSDIMMPKMDGFELIKRIRGNPALKNIYLILVRLEFKKATACAVWILEPMTTSPNHSPFRNCLRVSVSARAWFNTSNILNTKLRSTHSPVFSIVGPSRKKFTRSLSALNVITIRCRCLFSISTILK